MDEQFQDLFKIRYNGKKIGMGDILIAEPFLAGKYFSRAVVYIVEHDGKGTIGFVLNKPLPYSLSGLVREMEGIDFPVYLGGPVEQDKLYYLHTHPEVPDSLLIGGNVYWGGDFVRLAQMIREGDILPQEVRFFAGYSGWEPGQLQDELEDNSWMVSKILPAQVFASQEERLWENSMKALGGRYKIWANFPENPIMN